MQEGLLAGLAMWNRRYAGLMARLLIATVVASALNYGQLTMLEWLMVGLVSQQDVSAGTATAPAPAQGNHGQAQTSGSNGNAEHPAATSIPQVVHEIATILVLPLFVVLLAMFVLVRLASAVTSIWHEHTAGRLTMRTTSDLETEVLGHLLRKDDSFFSRHSPAETVNRLAVDLARVCGRRENWTGALDAGLLIIVSLVYFLGHDWYLALLALAGCAAGAWWAWRTTRQVKKMDADYLRQDDRVKARFEDLLRAAPEVQVANLVETVRARFTEVQKDRGDTYMKYVRLSSHLTGGGALAFVLTFLGMAGVLLYRRWHGSVGLAAALLPVVLYRLPDLFQQASQLIFIRLQFQLAGTSMKRLQEYETRPGEFAPGVSSAPTAAAQAPAAAKPLCAQGVTYRYTSADGAPQGGVADVTAQFQPGQWTAIVGGAGSGKSTLLRLLLGRASPQQGQVCYGDARLESMAPAQRAAVLSFMPQSLALLDASIAQNVTFGRPPGAEHEDLTAADREVLEQTGLAAICRMKAMDMTAGANEKAQDGIAAMRADLRRRLQETCGLEIVPYEADGLDRRHWLVEQMLGGRCDRSRAAELLSAAVGRKELRDLNSDGLGEYLANAARAILVATRRLLADPSYDTYCRLAQVPIERPVWALRAAHAHLADRPGAGDDDFDALCVIALTACPAEMLTETADCPCAEPAWRARHAASLGSLRRLLGPAWVPFDINRLHPFLTWRENLIFGAAQMRTTRMARDIDDALRQFVEQSSQRDRFLLAGLQYEIGRGGANLSGGQGQLVGLTRALLRRTPVVVLDEPTSALDPAARSRVAEWLSQWKEGRIVITVSHDVELAMRADQVLVLDGGRLAAHGSFEQLRQESQTFRTVMKQT
jgi:ABC-type multidrug transport system fused ATPase/permease subunit